MMITTTPARARLMRQAWLVLCLGLACLAAACTPKMVAPPLVPADPAQAQTLWHDFTAASAARAATDGPFRIQCSLRYRDGQGDGNRATAVIWGNGGLPVRLDVMAGIGALIARISQTDQELIVHSPRETKAWVHRGRGKAFLAFKVPIPLSVTDFIAVIDGRFDAVLRRGNGPAPQGVDPMYVGEARNGSIRYTLKDSALPGTVTLNDQGLLTEWQEAPGGWTMTLAYDTGTPPLPERLEISHPEGRHIVLDIKDRTTPSAPFTAAQLRLELPPDTSIQSLQQAAR